MVGFKGQIKHGELYIRCPHCGDSTTSTDRAHCSISAEGLYYCHRCGRGGQLSAREFLLFADYLMGSQSTAKVDDWQYVLEELLPGPGSQRASALERYHITDYDNRGVTDVFYNRRPTGTIVGLGLVAPGYKKLVGERAFGFAGHALISTRTDPIRIVEGPYDVVDERHVCTFGLPSRKQLKELLGQYVILTPDGDVWTNDELKTRMVAIINDLKARVIPGPFLLGVEILPPQTDPDQVPVGERRFRSLLA